MLELSNIHVSYGRVKVLFGVSFSAKGGEILCLIGRNGAGKTTILKSIMGLLKPSAGSVNFAAKDLDTLPAHEIPKLGIGYVPQGRQLFPEFTVEENLAIGMQVRDSKPETLAWVLEIFPRLQERLKQLAVTLSGGEQQMLAMARALCIQPKLLLLDEPTEGLQPSMIELIRNTIVMLKNEGLCVVLVEQRLDSILDLADQAVIIENGQNRESMSASEMKSDPAKLRHYLGV